MTRALDDLGLATVGATGVTGLAILARVQRGDIAVEAALPILVGAAAVCAALLIRRPAPSLAWLALIGGSLIASALPFERSRGADPLGLGAEAWSGLALQAAVAALVTLAMAARYATRAVPPRLRGSLAVAAGAWAWLAVACVLTIGLIVTGRARPDPAFTWVDVATAPLTYFLHLTLVVTVLGIVADVRAGMRRASDRGPTDAPGRTASGRAPGNLRALAIATLSELVPGQSAAAEATLAAERTRLAGDLHAVVLPGLRRAIAEAESGGDPDALARRLRSIDLELERLMADRWPVVLDAFGLVAALEDLAERIEADGRLAVQIDVGRVGDRPPPAIERAAWRVAQIAVDNAARHAEASDVTVTISSEPERVVLAVADDGRGFDPSVAGAVRVGARGLADATRRARAVGATIRIEARIGGGTMVVFDWTASPP
ncbi:MAG: ATP-binding protein [Candidatus Limnocylindrales bacterium]